MHLLVISPSSFPLSKSLCLAQVFPVDILKCLFAGKVHVGAATVKEFVSLFVISKYLRELA